MFIATGKGRYRKPMTGMWDALIENVKIHWIGTQTDCKALSFVFFFIFQEKWWNSNWSKTIILCWWCCWSSREKGNQTKKRPFTLRSIVGIEYRNYILYARRIFSGKMLSFLLLYHLTDLTEFDFRMLKLSNGHVQNSTQPTLFQPIYSFQKPQS